MDARVHVGIACAWLAHIRTPVWCNLGRVWGPRDWVCRWRQCLVEWRSCCRWRLRLNHWWVPWKGWSSTGWCENWWRWRSQAVTKVELQVQYASTLASDVHVHKHHVHCDIVHKNFHTSYTAVCNSRLVQCSPMLVLVQWENTFSFHQQREEHFWQMKWSKLESLQATH